MSELYFTQGGPKKYINDVTHSAGISIFSPAISRFCYIKKYRYRLDFDKSLIVLLSFLEPWIIVLINMVTILMMSTKVATPGLLKIKVLWKEGHYVTFSLHDFTNKFLSSTSNDIIDVIMWSNIGNCSISMRKVIITSIV